MNFIKDKNDDLEGSKIYFTTNYLWSVLERSDDLGKSLFKKHSNGSYLYTGYFSETWQGIEQYIKNHIE